MIDFAIIPYVGGIRGVSKSRPSSRPGYLRAMLPSIAEVTKHVIVSTFLENDKNEATTMMKELGIDGHVMIVNPPHPKYLPARTMRAIQSDKAINGLIYYTEADQILHCKLLSRIEDLLRTGNTHYIVPHRFNILYWHPTSYDTFEVPSAFCRRLRYQTDGKVYEVPRTPGEPFDDKFYVPKCRYTSFGGAYFINDQVLRSVVWNYSKVFPIEHTSGHDLYQQNKICLKASDQTELYTEHLSDSIYYEHRLKMMEFNVKAL